MTRSQKYYLKAKEKFDALSESEKEVVRFIRQERRKLYYSKNPDKYEKLLENNRKSKVRTGYNEKLRVKRKNKAVYRKFANIAGKYYMNEIKRLHSMGKPSDIISIRLNIPVSKINEVINNL